MDTRQLRAFCEVVERKSFSQAAERLGVTQPAVSLQVRALEKRLATQLLDRSGRRVEPTEAGAKLYRSAQRLLALPAGERNSYAKRLRFRFINLAATVGRSGRRLVLRLSAGYPLLAEFAETLQTIRGLARAPA